MKISDLFSAEMERDLNDWVGKFTLGRRFVLGHASALCKSGGRRISKELLKTAQ